MICKYCCCKSLTSIDLPASVAYLGSSCFQNCYSLSEVKIRNAHVVLLDSDGKVTDDNDAFAKDEYHYSELYIPEGTQDYYDADPWTKWFNAILSSLPYVATDIDGAPVQTSGQDKWFTVDGQPIEQPAKSGLFIKNGKKVVVK